MRTAIGRWGNSLGLRLPRHIAEATRLVEGATVKLEIEDGSIRVTPTRKRFKLSELLQGESTPHGGELDWGEPKGEEQW